jgi:O-antigen chain-terminating methyltransferase
MTIELPRPAKKPNRINKWLRINFLSPYIHSIPKNEKTLDLACGWGFSFNINPGFYGVDFDDECVNYCKQKGFNVTKANLLEPLPYPGEFFDNCFSHDVLEHFDLPEVDVIFKNVYKILRQGGTFINIIPNRRGYDYGFAINAGHKHFIIPDEIQYIADRMGFQYLGAYSAPVPQIINSWFNHAKYVTLCRRL